MRRFVALPLVIVAAIAPCIAMAAGADSCRSIMDGPQRLACYDRASGPATAPVTGGYARMPLIDWKVDRAKLRDQPVEVDGLIMPFASGALMSTEIGDMSPVFIEISAVPRDERRRILACSAPCRASVRGRGGSVMGQAGIIAEAVSMP